MRLLIKNGRVVDPTQNINNEVLDILVEGAKITRMANGIKNKADKVIDAKDKLVIPGLVDMHVHLREPGREDKETVASGTKAGLKGGVTAILAMPNTEPAIDSDASAQLLKKIIGKTSYSNVFICGAITEGRRGEKLTAIARLKKQGVVALSDDGASVDNAKLLLEALKIAKSERIVVICHCEDKSLSAGGAVNLGITSTRMGLRGISKESEYKRVERDILLAKKTNTAIHIAHISCAESVKLIRQAKQKGIKVTAETAPHYFALTEEKVWSYDTNMKMNPPLRAKEDAEAIRQGLKDGTIDVIASDHAPHTENEKDIEFELAEFGVTGLETLLPVSITELVHTGLLGWPQLIEKLAFNPARILGIDKGALAVGSDADIAIVAPQKEWLVKKEDFVSQSKNSAFLGRKLKGGVEYTICGGEIVYKL